MISRWRRVSTHLRFRRTGVSSLQTMPPRSHPIPLLSQLRQLKLCRSPRSGLIKSPRGRRRWRGGGRRDVSRGSKLTGAAGGRERKKTGQGRGREVWGCTTRDFKYSQKSIERNLPVINVIDLPPRDQRLLVIIQRHRGHIYAGKYSRS